MNNVSLNTFQLKIIAEYNVTVNTNKNFLFLLTNQGFVRILIVMKHLMHLIFAMQRL